jgi:hypothetical protein
MALYETYFLRPHYIAARPLSAGVYGEQHHDQLAKLPLGQSFDEPCQLVVERAIYKSARAPSYCQAVKLRKSRTRIK